MPNMSAAVPMMIRANSILGMVSNIPQIRNLLGFVGFCL